MLRYTLKRALSLALSLCLASVIIFAVVEVAPGDPASFMLGINAQPDTVAALRRYNLIDLPARVRKSSPALKRAYHREYLKGWRAKHRRAATHADKFFSFFSTDSIAADPQALKSTEV